MQYPFASVLSALSPEVSDRGVIDVTALIQRSLLPHSGCGSGSSVVPGLGTACPGAARPARLPHCAELRGFSVALPRLQDFDQTYVIPLLDSIIRLGLANPIAHRWKTLRMTMPVAGGVTAGLQATNNIAGQMTPRLRAPMTTL